MNRHEKTYTQKTVPKMINVQNEPYGPEGNLDCGHKNCNFLHNTHATTTINFYPKYLHSHFQ